MNPHASHSSSPIAMMRSIWYHRRLIQQMTWREISGRYKGTIFGLAWSFFHPMMMLTIYTFVFSSVFKVRWGIDRIQTETEYALILFLGLIIHALFAEVVNRSPTLILSNTNFVKKVVFPLEILTIINLATALFHALISITILLVATLVLNSAPSWTVVYAPLTLLPLLPLTLGLGWILASLGVYLRDIGQLIGNVTTVLLFLAPIFYPMTALPKRFQSVLHINPLTYPIEQTRAVVFFGKLPNWIELSLYTLVSMTICLLGFWWFQKTRKGFADVI